MNARRPRLVATDLDGTLLRSDGSISPRTNAAIAAVRASGIDVVFVTARPPRWLTSLAESVADDGLVICSNGALVVDLHTGEVRRSVLFAEKDVAQIVRAVHAHSPEVAFAVEYGWEFAAQPAFEPFETYHAVAALEELSVRPAAKILARHPTMDSDLLLAQLAEVLSDLATCTHSGVASRIVELSVPGVTKAAALAELCAERGIASEDVVAFGDMPNDLPMLTWAGQACAVANAHPDVLAAIDTHIPANDDDGVAYTLARLVERKHRWASSSDQSC